jgi:hypothetical protein
MSDKKKLTPKIPTLSKDPLKYLQKAEASQACHATTQFDLSAKADAILANWWISDFVSVRNVLDRWYNLTGKPILISDTAFLCPTDLRPTGDGANFLTNQRARGEAYQRFASELFVVPYILGWHWCAYIENRVRKSGIKDYLDRPYWDCVNLMKEFNTHQLYEILQQ